MKDLKFHKMIFPPNFLMNNMIFQNYWWGTGVCAKSCNVDSSAMKISLFRLTHDEVVKFKHFPCHWPLWGVTGGFLSQRPATQSFDALFDLHLSKQSRLRWFETAWRPLWRHCNRYVNAWLMSGYFHIWQLPIMSFSVSLYDAMIWGCEVG